MCIGSISLQSNSERKVCILYSWYDFSNIFKSSDFCPTVSRIEKELGRKAVEKNLGQVLGLLL
jgi:hypothetical protein